MCRSLFTTAITAVLLLSLISQVAAQDATPAPDSAGALTPAIGVPFPYVAAEGDAQAIITIAAVADPVEDVLDGYEPEPDTRYLMLTVVYENTGPGPIETRPDAFIVQDIEGNMWSPTSVQRGDEVTVPDLQRLQMAPGDRVSGMVGFQLPANAEVARIFYQPESSRLLLLADLGPQGQPAVGTEVDYEDAESTARGVITVTEIQDPFEEAPEGYEPEAGTRYLLLTIAVENTGSVPLEVSPSSVLARDGDGFLWGSTNVRRGEDIVVPDLQRQELAPGSRVSGVVGFQVPADADIADVLYQPVSGRLIFLARLQSVGAFDTPSSTVATTATDCEGVDSWFAETRERMTQATELSQQAALLEDEASLETAALEFEVLTAAQEAMDVPEGATEINIILVDAYTEYHEALTLIITAGDDGGEVQLALVEGMNAFNDASRDFAASQTQIVELAARCGIQT